MKLKVEQKLATLTTWWEVSSSSYPPSVTSVADKAKHLGGGVLKKLETWTCNSQKCEMLQLLWKANFQFLRKQWTLNLTLDGLKMKL